MLYEEPKLEIVIFEKNVYMAMSPQQGSNTENDDDDDMNVDF